MVLMIGSYDMVPMNELRMAKRCLLVIHPKLCHGKPLATRNTSSLESCWATGASVVLWVFAGSWVLSQAPSLLLWEPARLTRPSPFLTPRSLLEVQSHRHNSLSHYWHLHHEIPLHIQLWEICIHTVLTENEDDYFISSSEDERKGFPSLLRHIYISQCAIRITHCKSMHKQSLN